MITFRCRCSHSFTVPDDQAGESMQCPACGLLVDVPTLDDLHSLNDDGSYILEETRPAVVPVPDSRDTPSIIARHDQKDRRMALSDFLKIGQSDDDLLKIKGEVTAGIPKHPKYDPVTGELIRPMEMRREPVVAHAPVIAQPLVLGYQRVKVARGEATIWTPFLAMFALPNLIVLMMVTVLHIVTMTLAVMCFSMFPLAAIVIPMFMMIISHFANIVDETGPTANDEIPRPIRGANLYDDFFKPLVQVFFAFGLAYLPLWAFNHYAVGLPRVANLAMIVLLFGLVPAMLITVITSGAANNILPQRSLSVIGASGWDYLIASVVGLIATAMFLLGSLFAANYGNMLNVLILQGPKSLRGTLTGLPYWAESTLTVPLVLIGMYLVHVFCWQLGIVYRRHHEQFAWVLQKHDSSARTDTIAELHKHRQREAEKRAEAARQNIQTRASAAPGRGRSPR